MLGRGGMGVISVIGIIIVLGLLLTHSSQTSAIARTTFSGIDSIINDLELHPRSTLLS
jgi:uncharacterized membrane protein HdeD (DUF308 family)